MVYLKSNANINNVNSTRAKKSLKIKKKSLKQKKGLPEGTMKQNSLKHVVSNGAANDFAQPKRLNTYSFVNNPILYKHLSVTVPVINPKTFKEFNPFILSKRMGNGNKEHYSKVIKSHILEIVKEKLLKHRWGDVAIILQSYAYFNSNFFVNEKNNSSCKQRWQPVVFANVGKEVLFNHPLAMNDENLHLILTRSLNFFGISLDTSKIAIENGLYHLMRNDLEAAKESITAYDYIDKSDRFKERRREMALQRKNTADCYIGIINYCQWRNAVTTEDSNSLEDVTGYSEPGQSYALAEAMVEHFKDLWASNGVWDIAMLKNIEVLLHCYKLDLLQEDLTTYSEHHKNNPNAHKYLYSFLQSFMKNENVVQKLKKQALKRLQKSAIYDSLLLDLNGIYFNDAQTKSSQTKKRKKFLKSFNVLMDNLDYPACMLNQNAWCILEEQIKSAQNDLTESNFKKLIKALWVKSGRRTWWPRFHFSCAHALKIAQHFNQEFVKAKLLVARTLMGPECQFCTIIRQNV